MVEPIKKHPSLIIANLSRDPGIASVNHSGSVHIFQATEDLALA